MKKGFYVCVALLLTLAVTLTGCSLFGESGDKAAGKTDSISLLDGTKTYTIPEGLDYDTFYLCQIDVNPDDDESLLSEFLDYGIQKEYHVTYAKDGKAVQQDDIYICDTAENTKAMYDALAEMAGTTEGFDIYADDPTMIVMVYNQEQVEGMILQYAGYGIGLEADADAATYAQFDADMYSGYLINAQ